MSLKLILVLAFVALLFIALLIWSAARDDDDGGSGWTFDTLAGWAAGRAVQSSDIADRQDCYGGRVFTAPAGRPCEVEIRPVGGRFTWRNRQLALRLERGAKVQVQLTPSDDAPPVSMPLKAGTTSVPRLPIVPGGATLTLTCVQPDLTIGACQVRLAR